MSEPPPMQLGDTVAGRYRICEVIGRGGFSTIYRARQISVGRDVALKIMRTDVSAMADGPNPDEAELVERFRREAKVIARLDHPATVTLHDFGRTGSGHFFMALEYVDGTPLNDVAGRRLTPARTVEILRQALGSLHEAHEHGIVHRDVKPSNLMLVERRSEPDRVKVLDFGVAKLLEPTDGETIRKLTAETMVVGTPRYLAPENATGRDPGPPADIYSLGLLAYELLVGEKAVPGDEVMEILDYQLSHEFQPVLEQRPSIPEPLRRIVNRMIRKPLDRRYATAGEVLRHLDALPQFDDGFRKTAALSQPPAARPSAPAPNSSSPPPLPRSPARDASPPAEPEPKGERSGRDRTPANDALEQRNRTANPSGGASEASASRLAGERPRPDVWDSRNRPPSKSEPEEPEERNATQENTDPEDERATFPPGDTLNVERRRSDAEAPSLPLRGSIPPPVLLFLGVLALTLVAATTAALFAI